MEPFKIEKYIKNPNQILVLEHYKEPVEYWSIKEASVVMGKRLAVRVPETGYATCEVNLADGDTIRDDDGNLVGYIRVAEPGDLLPISIEVLSQMAAEMKVGDTIDFNQRKDEDHWGINKIHILGADVIVIGGYGGGSTYLHDLTIDCTQKDILEFLTQSLDDRATGIVYWEVPCSNKEFMDLLSDIMGNVQQNNGEWDFTDNNGKCLIVGQSVNASITDLTINRDNRPCAVIPLESFSIETVAHIKARM